MINNYEILEYFSKTLNKKIKHLEEYDANVGKTFYRMISFPWVNHQLSMATDDTLLRIEMLGIESKLAFSINRKDSICLYNKHIKINVDGERYDIFVSEPLMGSMEEIGIKGLEDFLSNPVILEEIRGLSLNKKESLHFYRNSVVLYLLPRPPMETQDVLNHLCQIADHLPSALYGTEGGLIVDGLRFDPDKLPQDLRVLAPYIIDCAIGDDSLRDEKTENMSSGYKKELVEIIVPLYDRIEQYLDSFADRPVPEEAILVQYLAELASELKPEIKD